MVDFKKYSKPAAVTILLLLLAMFWLLIAMPYRSLLGETWHDAERMHRKLVSLENMLKNKDTIRDKYRSIMNNRSLDSVYLNKGNGVIAGARLQGLVRRIVEKHGSVLNQSSIKKGTQDSAASITLYVTMTGTVESVYKTFHEIENGWPVMTLGNVNLVNQATNHRYKTVSNRLSASYEVTAYVK